MSINDTLDVDAQPTLRNGSTAAADVSFAKLNSEHHAESGSQAESSRSRERKSGLAERLTGEWEKRHSGHDSLTNGDKSSNGSSTPQRSKKTGGFLLDSMFSNGQPTSSGSTRRHGKRSEPNGHISIDKRASAQHRLSGESSQRSSPLSRELSTDKGGDASQSSNSSSRPPTMDPAQLVQMALNLSENRRRHASNPVAAIQRPNSSQFSDRLASSLNSDPNRELLGSRLSDTKVQRMSAAFSDEDQYYFSPATLARAEKARRYFELADKHRRLLQQLPAVPQNKQSGRSRALSRVSARSHVEQDEDVPLGRQYNPLQALRNRRTRQQQNFELPVAQFQDLDKVEHWVNDNV